jgi:multicomponent Na+:H+ antiporter subunit G
MMTYIFIGIGILFILVASIGIIRMPDVLTRMSVVSKAITFGLGFILLGVVVHFNDTLTLIKAVIIYIFLSLSTSIAASVIGLAAYKDKKTKLSDLTFLDEMSKENQDNS